MNCRYLFSTKSVRETLRIRTPSVPVIVIAYLPTVVDRVVVTVRVEVEVEPGERVTVVGSSERAGACVVIGAMEVESLTVAE